MLAGSFLKSTAVRLAIIYISLFVSAYLIANIVAYQMVVKFLDDRLNSNVMERYREIASAYEARGLNGAVQMIESHGPAVRGEETLYTLRGATDDLVAGNAKFSNVPTGLSTFRFNNQHESAPHYKLFRGPLGEYDLVVGISYGDTDQLARIVLISFGWATAIILGVGMTGASIFAHRTRRRISVLSTIAHEIGHGDLFKRLPISPRMDEIDVLSTEVNVALTRLESSVITLKQVTTDVAHDLKTPIARTFLVLEDSLQSDVPGDMKSGIEIALVELKSTAETFDAVLRIAQIESRSRTVNFRVFNLQSLVRDIYEVYEAIAVDAGYDLTLSDSISDSWIDGDPDLIKQLLANLLANAMRHTHAGSKIVLSLSNNYNSIYLGVSDNGPGIPREERERVFDRFYRLEKSRTTAGSGLGLTLVKAIVGLHGANIKLLDNDPGLSVVVGFPQVKRVDHQAH